MSSAVQKMEPPAITTMALTPMDMLNTAVQSGASLEMVEKLMGLKERWDANEARKAYDEAVAEAKADIPPITKDRDGHNSRYATFAAIAKVVDPIISKHGLSYRFRTEQTDRISVTCILSHRAGHFEQTTLSGPPDVGGSKNAIQAIGSTLTYLQRYSLVQMLGLAVAQDDDGKAMVDGAPITEEQFETLKALIVTVGVDIAKFCAVMKIEKVQDLPAKRFEEAKTRLNKFAQTQAKGGAK